MHIRSGFVLDLILTLNYRAAKPECLVEDELHAQIGPDGRCQMRSSLLRRPVQDVRDM